MIFNEYLAGAGLFELARKLNAMGVQSKRGNPMENRTVEYILRNPAYVGKIRWNQDLSSVRGGTGVDAIIADGTHDAIIPQAIWGAVQAKLDAQKLRFPKKAKTQVRQEFMLRGVIRCSSCGSTLVMSSRGIGLQCYSYAHGGCKVSHYINLPEVNDASVFLLESQLSSEQFALLHKSRQHMRDATEDLLSQEYIKLARVKTAYEAGIDTLEEYGTNKAKIAMEIRRLEALRPLPAQSEKEIKKAFAQKHKGDLIKLRDPNVPEEEKNQILRSFVERIVFDRATTSLDVVFYD